MNEGEERVRLDDSRLSVCLSVDLVAHNERGLTLTYYITSVLKSIVFYMCATTSARRTARSIYREEQ